eukprot:IDg7183t1
MLPCTTVRVRLAFYSGTLSPPYGYLRTSVRELFSGTRLTPIYSALPLSSIDSGILYKAVVKFPETVIDTCFDFLKSFSQLLVEYASEHNLVTPAFILENFKKLFLHGCIL